MSRIIFRPELVHPTVFIAPGAIVVGEVYLAEGVNIWFNAVLRGDVESLTLSADVNIQDGCVLHTSHGYLLLLEEGVSVGHRAIVHGARVGRNTLIGMGALLLDASRPRRRLYCCCQRVVTGREALSCRFLDHGQPRAGCACTDRRRNSAQPRGRCILRPTRAALPGVMGGTLGRICFTGQSAFVSNWGLPYNT